MGKKKNEQHFDPILVWFFFPPHIRYHIQNQNLFSCFRNNNISKLNDGFLFFLLAYICRFFFVFFSLFFLSLALTAVVCVANALLMLMSPLFSGRSIYVFDTHTRTNRSTLTSLKVPFKLGKKLFCSCKSWIKHGKQRVWKNLSTVRNQCFQNSCLSYWDMTVM